MKRYGVCGLGNGLVDIFLEITEEEFSSLKLEKGSMRLVDAIEQETLLNRFKGSTPKLASGGSVANSIIAYSQLGGRGAFICALGDDRYGVFYKGEFDSLSIELGTPFMVGETTGTCVSLITPDAERTMRTCLAVTSKLSEQEVDEQRIKDSEWLFIEGYVFMNPQFGPAAIDRAVSFAKKHGTKIAVTVSEDFVVHTQGEALRRVLNDTTLLFANEKESCALSGASNYKEAFRQLSEKFPMLAVTAGDKGALVKVNDLKVTAPAFPCTPVDLTGAGDMFAGALLYGISQKLPLEAATRGACYLASQVIQRFGARLHSGVSEFFKEAVSGKPISGELRAH